MREMRTRLVMLVSLLFVLMLCPVQVWASDAVEGAAQTESTEPVVNKYSSKDDKIRQIVKDSFKECPVCKSEDEHREHMVNDATMRDYLFYPDQYYEEKDRKESEQRFIEATKALAEALAAQSEGEDGQECNESEAVISTEEAEELLVVPQMAMAVAQVNAESNAQTGVSTTNTLDNVVTMNSSATANTAAIPNVSATTVNVPVTANESVTTNVAAAGVPTTTGILATDNGAENAITIVPVDNETTADNVNNSFLVMLENGFNHIASMFGLGKDVPAVEENSDKTKDETSTETIKVEVKNEQAQLEELYKLVEAEAGIESAHCKEMVTAVVLNRVRSDKFPNTIHDVINDPGEFSVVKSNALNRVEVTQETIDAVNRVYQGKADVSDEVLFFRSNYYFKWCKPLFSIDHTYFSTFKD